MENKKKIDLIIISILMFIFGTGEFITVISVSINNGFDLISYLAIILGSIYLICGFLIFIRKKNILIITLLLLLINIIIRVIMFFTGLYPVNNITEIIGYIVGISFVMIFLIYLFIRRNTFK